MRRLLAAVRDYLRAGYRLIQRGPARHLSGAAACALVLAAGCAEMVPTTEPVSPAHWHVLGRDVIRRRVYALAVNSSMRPVVLDCSDTRRIIPPRTDARVLIFDGEHCDLQPRITYEDQ